ncbi:MAG: hypothetical protein HYW05_05385 [Candidatus Diapherotrites archaeon]|nr:hypothetical protein [Candidatus Diapherotrites archaeon]
MPTLSVLVDKEFVKNVDAVLDKTRIYSSRSEFIKDAIREKTIELVEKQQKLSEFRKGAKRLSKLALKRGYKGKLPTREERAKIADSYLREIGIIK